LNAKDGLLRRGILITPPDYQQGRLYPTIVVRQLPSHDLRLHLLRRIPRPLRPV